MADAAPTMSGANEAVSTAMRETTADATEGQAETQASSIPPAAAAAQTDGQEEEKTATEPAAATATAAPTAAPSGSTTPAAASGVLEMPQPPPAAVVRDHTEPDDEIAPVAAAGAGATTAGAAAAEAAPAATADSGLICNITLLLPNGNRHPFRIDEKYLTKRGVEVPSTTEGGHKDPFSVSVYKLKELILREWREEWEGKPASPSSIRLIHFGKLLDDKEQLRKYHFSPESPNVVHMSVKPADVLEDEEAAKGKTGGREARSREGGSGCCIIL